MKKTILTSLVAGLLAISSLAYGQNPGETPFISKTVPAIPTVINETTNIRVSKVDGVVGNENAFSLVFENKSNVSVTFTWTVKDKSGKIIGTPHKLTLLPNSTLDYTSKNGFTESMVILVAKNALASDYTVEIL